MDHVKSFKDLEVYKSSRGLQQAIYQLSKRWPRVEEYALTSQVRRSSRSVGANLAEAWAKRQYPAHFLSKLTDSDGELQETEHWLSTAWDCGYVSEAELRGLTQQLTSTGRLLGAMLRRYEWFCYKRPAANGRLNR